MTTLKEISLAFKQVSAAHNALHSAMLVPPECSKFDPTQIAEYYGAVSKAAQKLAKVLEKFHLPPDTVYYLNTEIEFAIWSQSQQA